MDKSNIQAIIDQAENKITAGWKCCGKTLSFTSDEIKKIWQSTRKEIDRISWDT